MGWIIAGMAVLLLALGALTHVLRNARRLTRDLDTLIVDQTTQRHHTSTSLDRVEQAALACISTDVVPLDLRKRRRR